ncbi:MAG: serine/threonine protein kinase, partial [Deltaproteobacteria bacterium]|nr:serine/threonine protein kinase [Nannocystaceae bacterium]
MRARVLMRLLGEDEGPAKIGRFTLLERVAEGGMGVVFAAYDAELDRKVAVKLLRRDLCDESVRKRIVREAQAMAKLSHPNVAQVFEVGEHQGGTFIAMEFVRGETLRVWQQHADRTWRELLVAYIQAGRGLAAAHAAGLVHRDFKPDNAIVGRDGAATRVRVLDFGLARSGGSEAGAELEADAGLPAPNDDALGTPLTHAGSILGTPAYMAPEQFLGEAVTPKTDQFALCVALWEALYGERPFAGRTRAELGTNVVHGRVREPPRQSGVPSWVRAALLRGLACAPADRFATTDALLGALQEDASRRRRRVVLAAGAMVALALGVAGLEGARRYRLAQKTAACDRIGASIDASWNDETRARVREGLVATGISYAPSTAEHAMPWLDEHAQNWREHAVSACMNHTVFETWEQDTFDRAQWCLDERRLELESLVADLIDADDESVHSAVLAAARLAPAAPCLDATTLAQLPPPPPELAREE